MHVQPLAPWRSILPWDIPSFGFAGQSITAAFSVMLAGPALSAFAIFHSSECADVVNVPGGNGVLAVEGSSSMLPSVSAFRWLALVLPAGSTCTKTGSSLSGSYPQLRVGEARGQLKAWVLRLAWRAHQVGVTGWHHQPHRRFRALFGVMVRFLAERSGFDARRDVFEGTFAGRESAQTWQPTVYAPPDCQRSVGPGLTGKSCEAWRGEAARTRGASLVWTENASAQKWQQHRSRRSELTQHLA